MHSHISPYLPQEYDKNPERFFWPVNRNKVVDVRNRFMKKMIALAKGREKDYYELYPVLSLLWVNHVIQAYQISVAVNYFQKNKIVPNFDGDSGFFRTAYEDKSPPLPDYIVLLENGVEKSSLFLENLKGIKRLFSDNPISYKPLCFIDFKRDIVINSTGELIFKHAVQKGHKLYYVPRSFWFQSIKNEVRIDFDGEEFIGIVKECFAEDAHLLNSVFDDWLKEIYSRSMNASTHHVKRILSRPNHIPMNYWMGSGGVMWDRILKYAVKKAGGTVTGHDHGSGIGHMKSISRALSECNDCDYFVSFSQNKQLFEQALDHDFLFGGMPQLISLENKKEIQGDKHFSLKRDSLRKILIIPYGPDGNTARFIATPHDSVKVDLLVRVLEKLSAWGYEVYLKPHPHCPLPLSMDYISKNNITLLQGSIEDAFYQTDAALFLHHYTTTFRQAFEHNMPIILIDPAYEEWVEGARVDLEQRCSIISSSYDDKNRIILDWNELEQGMNLASQKNHDGFYLKYYQNI